MLKKVKIDNLEEAEKLIQKTGCDTRAIAYMAKKAILEPVFFENIDNRALNIIKQNALSIGAEFAISEDVSRFKKGVSDAVLFATKLQMEKLIVKMSCQPFGIKEIAKELTALTTQKTKIFKYKNNSLDLTNPVVMAIVNLDPNSFSGDAVKNIDEALEKVVSFEESGAKIIDIGAESSRPGSKPLGYKNEIKRLLPVLKAIRKQTKLPISIDTYNYETAKAAIDEGADIINDIYALRFGKEKLAKLIAKTKVGLVLMHMKGTPQNMQKKPMYKNCVNEVYEFLKERKDYALNFGIHRDYICVDFGIGFGKSVQDNMALLKNTNLFKNLGVVLTGLSRKSFVKAISGNFQSSFIMANCMAVLAGADIVRVHDVKETVKALDFIKEYWRQ